MDFNPQSQRPLDGKPCFKIATLAVCRCHLRPPAPESATTGHFPGTTLSCLYTIRPGNPLRTVDKCLHPSPLHCPRLPQVVHLSSTTFWIKSGTRLAV